MKHIISLVLVLATSQLVAQTTLNFRTTMFNNLTTSKLSTNVLANKAGMPDSIFGFNGSSACNASTFASWQYAYQSLYVGFIGTPSYPTPETILAQVPDSPTSEIKINGLYYKYNHLADNAVSSGLIHLTDTLFYDGPNSGNPYLEKTCVAVSPMYPAEVPLNVIFRGGAIYGNLTANIASASIDFGNGSGYVSFVANNLYDISYTSEGTYTITLRLTLTNSSVVYARSSLKVSGDADLFKSTSLSGFHDDYPCDDVIPKVVPDENYSYQIVRSGSNNDGLIKVWYGKNGSGQTKTSLTKPIVIVDGFDPVPLKAVDRSAEHIYFETNYNNSYPDRCNDNDPIEDRMDIIEGLLDRLGNLGYDIAIVDFEWGGNYISENVETLKQCITHINNLLSQNGSTEQLIIMGPSMGALISRIALSQMTSHNAKLYISYDGPHKGAYIPMPLQRLYGTALNEANQALTTTEIMLALFGWPAQAVGLLNFQIAVNGVLTEYSPLTCPAAQQMLMYHYTGTTGNNAFAPSSLHTSLYNSIAGVYPQNCMNVAISCGDGHGNNQTTFSDVTQGADYLNYLKGNAIKCKIEFKELPDNGTLSPYMRLNLYSEKWGIKFNYFNKTYYSSSTSTSKSYERRPGGSFNGTNELFGLLGTMYDRYECFMPLASVFDLASNVSNNIFSEFGIPSDRNFVKNNYPSKSPFDMLYVCDENRYHVLRGPQPVGGDASVPGMNQDMGDFVVFLVENLDYIEGATQSAVYDLYDIYYNNGIQTCSQAFNVDLLENGIVTKSYNSSAVTISDATLTGNNKSIEVYSTQGITIGNNTTIGNGTSFLADFALCPQQ